MSKGVEAVTKPVEKVVKKAGKVVENTVKGVGETIENTYMAGRNVVEGTGHLIAGHSDEAKDKFTSATDKAIQAGTNIATGGLAEGVAPKLLDKASGAIAKETIKVTDSLMQPTVDTLRSVGHVAEAGYDVIKGDWKEAGKNIAKATGEITKAGMGSMTLGLGKAYTPNLLKSSGEFGEMVGNYSTGNFNAGSQNLENLTGWDVDNSIAEEKERAAKAKYQAEVDKANAAEARNRRANLLALRKALVPSLSRSSQGGGGAGYFDEKRQGGITLG